MGIASQYIRFLCEFENDTDNIDMSVFYCDVRMRAWQHFVSLYPKWKDSTKNNKLKALTEVNWK